MADGDPRRIQRSTDLTVWQRTMGLTDAVYTASDTFPRDEAFGLTSQIRRAAVSVPPNIAEGWGRGRTKKSLQFLRIARGSLYEVATQLRIAERRGYVAPDAVRDVLRLTVQISKMLPGLMKSLATR